MIMGFFILFTSLKMTGFVIGFGFSKINYFSIIGLSFLIIGAFFSLEDILSGIKLSHKKEKNNDFKHRLNMARVSQPIYYVFNKNTDYDYKSFRKNLRKTRAFSRSEEKELRNTKEKYRASLSTPAGKAYYKPFTEESRFSSHPFSLNTYAHEFIHHLNKKGLVPNDYVIANALEHYMSYVKEYEQPVYSQVDLHAYKPQISKPENLRPLKKEEKKNPHLENSQYPGFNQTGIDLGGSAAYLEGISKKTGVGLYFIKLVSDGTAVEKAKEIVLGNYAPLNEFEKKYGKRWKRILERVS